MEKNKSTNLNWLFIILAVMVFFIIGIFVTIDKRRRIFAKWKQTIAEIRLLRMRLRGLYLTKEKLDRRSLKLFFCLKVISITLLIGLAQLIHWEYNVKGILSFSAAFTIVCATYHVVIFLFFAKKYTTQEAIEYFKCKVTYAVYKVGDLDIETIKIIEEQIELKMKEATILKQQLRPEAQIG